MEFSTHPTAKKVKDVAFFTQMKFERRTLIERHVHYEGDAGRDIHMNSAGGGPELFVTIIAATTNRVDLTFKAS